MYRVLFPKFRVSRHKLAVEDALLGISSKTSWAFQAEFLGHFKQNLMFLRTALALSTQQCMLLIFFFPSSFYNYPYLDVLCILNPVDLVFTGFLVSFIDVYCASCLIAMLMSLSFHLLTLLRFYCISFIVQSVFSSILRRFLCIRTLMAFCFGELA